MFFLWFLVVISDFLIEFRFEYLWPIYLLIRNIYDTFKYQGLAFCAFFVFITLTSNAICFFLMPVQWLFFTASTYVWFQYVWNSEKGICLQTFTVWLIFVYIEATVRLKELKNLSTNLDLCRPMAAHSIGSQVVMLGFGVKKYLNYKIMLKKQKEVQNSNEITFYTINRLHMVDNQQQQQTLSSKEQLLNNNTINNDADNDNEEQFTSIEQFDQQTDLNDPDDKRISIVNSFETEQQTNRSNLVLLIENFFKLSTIYLNAIFRNLINLTNSRFIFQSLISFISFSSNEQKILENSKLELKQTNCSSSFTTNSTIQQQHQSDTATALTNQDNNLINSSSSNGSSTTPPSPIGIHLDNQSIINQNENSSSSSENQSIKSEKMKKQPKQQNQQQETSKNELKKLRLDLQMSKQAELDYKEKLTKVQNSRNELKFQCSKLQSDNTALQTKLQNSLNTSKQDKNLISELEKRIQEERRLNKTRGQLDNKLTKNSSRQSLECGETCKQKMKDYDDRLVKLKEEIQFKDLQITKLKEEILGNKTLLLTTLNSNALLENKLREETKLKLDLFQVLGETKRQLDINKLLLYQKTSELDQFNKLSELIAVMPNTNVVDPYSNNSLSGSSLFLPNFISSNITTAATTSVSSTLTPLSNSSSNNLNANNLQILNNNLNNNNLTSLTTPTESTSPSFINTAINSNLITPTSNSPSNNVLNQNLINISNNSTLSSLSNKSNKTSTSSTKDGSIDQWKNSLEFESTSDPHLNLTPKPSDL